MIGEALKSNNALTTLCLLVILHFCNSRKPTYDRILPQENQIGDEGAEKLGEALKSNNTLKILVLEVDSF